MVFSDIMGRWSFFDNFRLCFSQNTFNIPVPQKLTAYRGGQGGVGAGAVGPRPLPGVEAGGAGGCIANLWRGYYELC